jgi:hypothetical protein
MCAMLLPLPPVAVSPQAQQRRLTRTLSGLEFGPNARDATATQNLDYRAESTPTDPDMSYMTTSLMSHPFGDEQYA